MMTMLNLKNNFSENSTKDFHRTYKAASKQQWVPRVMKAEWEEGKEPRVTGKTTTPKEVSREFEKYYRMLFAEKEISEKEMKRLKKRAARAAEKAAKANA